MKVTRSPALQCVRVCIVFMYGFCADMQGFFAQMQGVCVVGAYQSSYLCYFSVCVYIYCGFIVVFLLKCRVVWWLLCIDLHTHVTLQCVCVCIVHMYGFFAEMWGFPLLIYRDLVLKYEAVLLLIAALHVCACLSLFCGNVGLFCGNVGLFCGSIRLFCSSIALPMYHKHLTLR